MAIEFWTGSAPGWARLDRPSLLAALRAAAAAPRGNLEKKPKKRPLALR